MLVSKLAAYVERAAKSNAEDAPVPVEENALEDIRDAVS